MSDTGNEYDAVIVGAGPNGLAAGVVLALNGLSVLILEEKATIGGGTRTEELTLPGYLHDVCSSIHPLAIGSPFFRRLPLADYGLEWIHPVAPLAHPFDDGTCVLLERSLEKTCAWLDEDGRSYRQLISLFVENWDKLESFLLGPLTLPRHPILALRFAMKGLCSASHLAKKFFKSPKAQGFFSGLAAHSILPMDCSMTAAVGLVLAITGHVYGWPMPRGGAQSIAKALGDYFAFLGGKIETGFPIDSFADIPSSQAVLFDLTPRQILHIAGDQLNKNDQKQLAAYRYGPGVFKIDWALDGPIPWKAEACLQAGTVHIGATLEEIAKSEKAVWEGKHPEKPYVILVQNSLFDSTRAPRGKHTAWAYCHVPHGSTLDRTVCIENQIEHFAPHFRVRILSRSTKNTEQMRQFNSNYIGGDIIGGVQDIWQLFTRPTRRFVPYATSHPRLFICSSSTPPGGGVHGMCGFHAAKTVLKKVFGITFSTVIGLLHSQAG